MGFGQVGSGRTVPPVLVLTAGYSQWRAAKMIPTRHAEDLVLGQWAVTQQLGAVPKLYVWDNEGGVGRYGGANPKLTQQFQVLRGLLGTRIYVCKPRDPEAKGKVERTNGFFETSFLPGGGLPIRMISTRSWPSSWPGPMGVGGAACRALRRPSGLARTGRRWGRCRRSTWP